MRVHDTVLGALFIMLAMVFLALTSTFPAFPGQKYGPALFPRILGIAILLCGVVIIWQGRHRPAPDGARKILALDPLLREPRRLISFLLVPGSILFYLLAAERLGFIPTAFILLLSLMAWFHVRLPWALGIALGMTWLMNWFFGTMMRVPLPRGLYMQLLYGG